VSDGNDYSVRYEYDAVGNRRLVDASYWDATAGARKPQTYWYKYNNLNQVQVTKGMLVGVDGKPHARGTGLLDTQARIEAPARGSSAGVRSCLLPVKPPIPNGSYYFVLEHKDSL
jgi:hypothetical protein